jgi:hypothetical protein
LPILFNRAEPIIMKITVTREDIQNGRRHNPSGCPVGLAIQRAGVPYCCVTGGAVVMRHEHRGTTALLLPEAVQNWIADFDQARSVEPISFELGLPVSARCDGFHKGGAGHQRCSQHNGHGGAVAARCRLAGASKAG